MYNHLSLLAQQLAPGKEYEASNQRVHLLACMVLCHPFRAMSGAPIGMIDIKIRQSHAVREQLYVVVIRIVIGRVVDTDEAQTVVLCQRCRVVVCVRVEG